MEFPARSSTLIHPCGVWVMVCPCNAPPYQMHMPLAGVFDAVEEHLITLAPECDDGSQHMWGIDSHFTFRFDAASAGQYILFGVCNENGPHAQLARNEHVSAMLEFYTGSRGAFGPFAFVLAHAKPAGAEIEEVPVDIDSVWPLQRILDHWEAALRERKQRRQAELARMGANVTFHCF